MLFKSLIRFGVLTAMGCIVLMALSLSIAGCGKSTEERELPVTVVKNDSHKQAPVLPDEGTAADAPAGRPAEEVVEAEAEPGREVTYEEAEAAYHEGRYDDAEDLFMRYAERKERNPWGHYMLGLSAWKAGDTATATAAFEQAIALDPNHVKSYLNLGRVLLEANRTEEALSAIEAALAIDPRSVDGLRLEGRAFHQMGRVEEAIAAYRRAIRSDDTDAWSMNNLALVLIEQGRFEDALAPLARAVEIRGDVALFHNNLGMALEHTGHIRAAEDAYRMASELDGLYEHAADNLERVELVVEDAGVSPVDLAALANAFRERLASWNETVVASDVDGMLEPDSGPGATSVADSTGDGQNP